MDDYYKATSQIYQSVSFFRLTSLNDGVDSSYSMKQGTICLQGKWKMDVCQGEGGGGQLLSERILYDNNTKYTDRNKPKELIENQSDELIVRFLVSNRSIRFLSKIVQLKKISYLSRNLRAQSDRAIFNIANLKGETTKISNEGTF